MIFSNLTCEYTYLTHHTLNGELHRQSFFLLLHRLFVYTSYMFYSILVFFIWGFSYMTQQSKYTLRSCPFDYVSLSLV